MSGTLVIRENATWMPTGWVFSRILEGIEAVLGKNENSLIIDVLKETTMSGYGNFHQLNATHFQNLMEAAEQAYFNEVEKGFDTLSDPSSYFSLMYSFSQLKALLKTDVRAMASFRQALGTIIIRDDVIWTAPEWTFCLVLEHFEAHVRTSEKSSSELSSFLLETLKSEGTGQCDLRILDEHKYSKLFIAAEWLYAHYGDGKGRLSHAPSFFTELGKYVTDLCNLLDQTTQAAARPHVN